MWILNSWRSGLINVDDISRFYIEHDLCNIIAFTKDGKKNIISYYTNIEECKKEFEDLIAWVTSKGSSTTFEMPKKGE